MSDKERLLKTLAAALSSSDESPSDVQRLVHEAQALLAEVAARSGVDARLILDSVEEMPSQCIRLTLDGIDVDVPQDAERDVPRMMIELLRTALVRERQQARRWMGAVSHAPFDAPPLSGACPGCRRRHSGVSCPVPEASLYLIANLTDERIVMPLLDETEVEDARNYFVWRLKQSASVEKHSSLPPPASQGQITHVYLAWRHFALGGLA